VKVVALGALERAEVETHARGHDASEHHASTTLGTSGVMDASVDVFGPGTKFCHDASLEKVRRAQRHLSPAICPWEERADSDNLGFQSFASLFNMDQFTRRNEALLNTAFLHLARFSTKTTDGSNNILCTKELPSDEGARSQFRWRSPHAI
jgi:hypothetical protein